MPGVDDPAAAEIAERIRTAVMKKSITINQGSIPVTLSLGLGVTPKDRALSAESVVAQVDKALYESKNAGRNCVRKCVLD